MTQPIEDLSAAAMLGRFLGDLYIGLPVSLRTCYFSIVIERRFRTVLSELCQTADCSVPRTTPPKGLMPFAWKAGGVASLALETPCALYM